MIRELVYKLVKRYRHSTVPRWIVLGIDMLIFVVAFVLTELFSLRHAADIEWSTIWTKFLMMGGLTLLSFLAVGSYKGIIRHAGFSDIYKIILAGTIPLAVCWVINLVNNNITPAIITRNYLPSYRESLMMSALLIIMIIFSRMVMQRIYNQYFRRHRPQVNVIIYGAGAAGVIAQNALQQDLHYEYNIVSFADDDRVKINQELNGVPVRSVRDVLTERFVYQKHVQQFIIAIPNIRLSLKRAVSSHALDLGLVVKSVPHITMWINGSFSSSQIEDIKIEDLLQRETIKMDNMNIVREVLDKVVLVTGAAGSIGSEICRQLIQYKPSKIVMLDQAESPMYDLQFELRNKEPYRSYVDHMEFVIANVKDERRMREVFDKYHPQLIYHAAAYKHVPFMEENPYEAIYVNVFGTKNLADLAIEYKAQKFVMISTDKAVNPTNVMGATKRMAEIYIQSRSNVTTHFVTTRFGNVLGSNGSVIPLFNKQLADGGPLTVTHRDIIRYFMTIPEACNLVLEAGAMGEGGDIFVFDMGRPVRIYDLARRMIQLSGLRNIEIKEIGLRPGEKLYEELLATKENTIATYHPKIMRAQVRRYDLAEIDREYAELWQLMPTLDPMRLVAKMKSIVPEFVSNNSVFCALDQQAADSSSAAQTADTTHPADSTPQS